MKESLLNFLYYLSKNFFVNKFFKLYYRLTVVFVNLILKANQDIESIYIKGGFARGDYEPIVSDIDYVVIINKKLSSTKLIKLFFPLVKDIDVYTHEDLNERLKYGSLKYSDKENWLVIKGNFPCVEYLYYPKKLKIDILEEIYFYYEWLFENIQNNKLSSYRRGCLKRNFNKVKSLALTIVSSEKSKCDISEVVISTGDKNDYKEKFVSILSSLAKDIKIDDIIIDEYFLETFNFDNIEDNNKIFMTHEIFKLFYDTGCIDTYIILKNLTNTNSMLFNALQCMRYKFKITDGKTNHIHRDLSDIKVKEDIQKSLKILNKVEIYNYHHHDLDTLSFVTASWGDDYLNRLVETHNTNREYASTNTQFLHVSIGGDRDFLKNIKTLTVIRINDEDYYQGLWHKESLFNLALDYLGLTQMFIFSDIDAIIKDKSWYFDIQESLTSQFDAIQPFSTFKDEKTGAKTYSSVYALDKKTDVFYAPGLIWAFSRKGVDQLEYFFDIFHDGSNDGVLFKKITKSKIGVIEDQYWLSSEVEEYLGVTEFNYSYLDYEIDHVSHPRRKHYVNMIEYLNLLYPQLKKSLIRSDIGLWRWVDSASQEFVELFRQFREDRGYSSNKFIRSIEHNLSELLISKVQESTFYLNDEKKISSTTGVGELTLLSGTEAKGMFTYSYSVNEVLKSKILFELENIEKEKYYSISFMIESDADLSEIIEPVLKISSTEERSFQFKKVNYNLWYASMGIFSWYEIIKSRIELGIHSLDKCKLYFSHYKLEAHPEERDWEWFCELKSEKKAIKNSISIESRFTPAWYKAVIKLSVSAKSYVLNIRDSYGMELVTAREQVPADDYLTVYFKTTMVSEEMEFDFEFDGEFLFSYDIVVYN